jgi:hypothetical protein
LGNVSTAAVKPDAVSTSRTKSGANLRTGEDTALRDRFSDLALISRRRSGPTRSRTTVAPPTNAAIFPARPHHRIVMNPIIASPGGWPPPNHAAQTST